MNHTYGPSGRSRENSGKIVIEPGLQRCNHRGSRLASSQVLSQILGVGFAVIKEDADLMFCKIDRDSRMAGTSWTGCSAGNAPCDAEPRAGNFQIVKTLAHCNRPPARKELRIDRPAQTGFVEQQSRGFRSQRMD